MGRVIKKLIFALLIILMTSSSSFANIYNDPHSIGLSNKVFTILLIGIKQRDLAHEELGNLKGKKVIEIDRTNDWVDAVDKTEAQEVVIRQNSGFVGLYTPGGELVRPVRVADGSNPIQQETRVGVYNSYPMEELYNKQGYQTGGVIDPYRPQEYVSQFANNARLSPGWGYNSNYNKPRSARSTFVDLMNFVPLDVATPFNYAGQFGSNKSITAAYGLGVIPHIAGLATRMRRGQAEKADYDYYKRERGMPDYLERSPNFYFQGARNEPSNPIVTDPNFIRYENAPQAFQEYLPNYGNSYTTPKPNFLPGT